MSLLRYIVGRPLSNREAPQHKLGVIAGLPAMGLDGLASSAYGPEAALAMLMPLGAAGIAHIVPVTLAVVGVLGVLYLSYRQTIRAYPVNGGSYTVAKENLGITPGLFAASALMVDYVLNVAVGISAGIAALVSAIPSLQPYTLWLCLAVLALVTVFNLRGTMEAGLAVAVPTYLFIAAIGLVLAIGVAKAVLAGGYPQPILAPPEPPKAMQAFGTWLLLRAFASGCTAMTGVEAVSNGVSAFRDPPVKPAHRTLTAIVCILAVLLVGIAYLVGAYGIGAMDQTRPGYQSVLSQLMGAVIGRGSGYDVAIGSLLAVLVLSANTSFVGFPRLCGLVARDDFLPRSFAAVGRRLVYTVGVLYLACAAGVLLVVFGGVTNALVPLFAVGAFLAFTLSQAGMAVHWRRALRASAKSAPRERTVIKARLAINSIGAAVTALALAIILVAKFAEGAWITVLVIPTTFLLLRSIKRYYAGVNRLLRKAGPMRLQARSDPVVLIPTNSWNRMSDRAVAFAINLSSNVIAVHLTALGGPEVDEHEHSLRRQWADDVEAPARAAGLAPPRLEMIRSPYRKFVEPLLKLIEQIEHDYPRRLIAVVIPELIAQHWWQVPLHSRRAQRLHRALMRHGGSRVVVIEMPLYLEEPSLDDALEKEDKRGPKPPAARPAVGRRSARSRRTATARRKSRS